MPFCAMLAGFFFDVPNKHAGGWRSESQLVKWTCLPLNQELPIVSLRDVRVKGLATNIILLQYYGCVLHSGSVLVTKPFYGHVQERDI